MSKPRPLKWAWVRWKSAGWTDWSKWHAVDVGKLLQWGLERARPGCSKRVLQHSWIRQFTADTPDRKDCCKKCWRKVKDETQS